MDDIAKLGGKKRVGIGGRRRRRRPPISIGGASGMRTCKGDAADELVPPDVVKVHDADVERALPDLLPRHVEGERLIEDGIEVALVDGSLPLLHPLVAKVEPDLHVGICANQR